MPTQTIEFTEWTPDQPSVVQNLSTAKNVIATSIGYAPFPSSVNYSQAASENLNSVFVAKYSNTTSVYAGGATKLFKLDGSDFSMDNVSKSGGYSDITRWSFCQFGDVVIAANNEDKLQYTLGSTFADLSVDAPIAKYVTVVRDFVVAANLDSGANFNKVQWSDINDETDWVSGGASQSDFQILPDGGNITGITGGEFGLIFLERAIYRMSYIGSPFFFQFDTISKSLGCTVDGSITKFGNISYFLGEDGFYSCDGQAVTPIGNQKVDRWFYSNASPALFSSMTSTVDPSRKIVIWNFANIFGGRSLIIYNWQVGKWTYGDTTTEVMATLASPGVSLEGLTSAYEINAYQMVAGKSYDIRKLGSGVNWTSIGAADAVVGARVTRNATSITGSSATYTQTASTTLTVTLTAHGLTTGDSVYLDFTSGTAVDGNYIVTVLTVDTFTIVQAISRTTSGNVTVYSGIVIDLEAAAAASYTLDTMTTSLDSPLFSGGQYFLGGADGAYIVSFTGQSMSAQIDTGYVGSQYNSTVTLARPIVDNGSADVAILSVNLLSEVKDFGSYTSADTENRVPLRSNGKYHKLSIKPTGSRWSNTMAVEIDVSPQGVR